MKSARKIIASTRLILIGLILLATTCSVNSFVETKIRLNTHRYQARHTVGFRLLAEPQKKNLLQKLLDPYPTNIPPELKEEIYKAESNTASARERSKRVLIYGVVGFVLVTCAFTNGFLTELRSAAREVGEVVSPADFGFGWVEANGLFKFIFLNGLGGAMALFGGAASGMMAEAELDSRRRNAEDIYEELVRRREGKGKQKAKTSPSESPSKKKQSASQKKRLAALTEVINEKEPLIVVDEEQSKSSAEDYGVTTGGSVKDEGFMGKLKGFYEKADNMAASQALLLNKELEDRGVIEKITDESGLKIIGRDAAAKLIEEKTVASEGNQSASSK